MVDHEVVKNTKFNILKRTVNNLEKKIFDATTLHYEYNIDKQNLQAKIGEGEKKHQIQAV